MSPSMPRFSRIFPLAVVWWLWSHAVSCLAGSGMVAADVGLAHDPQWLALLHMRRGLDGVYRSEVDAEDFFLSHRKNDAVAELRATISALRKREPGSYSAWCRFPARAHFLSGRLALQPPPGLQCPDLEYWRGRFYPEEIVLVYPEPYLKNVASIFGHTFLRIDASDKQKHPVLLSTAVSYYADVGSAGGTISYIAKGLAGDFAGVIEIAPYFQKLRKYSDGEDRDIREYRLKFSPEQARIFVDHVWEVRGHSFNYFFLDENCSYRLIAMLDVISPTHRLREAFGVDAIPVDTIKVLRDNNIIAESTYIPSARKRFYEQLAQLDKAQRMQLDALVKGQLHDDDVADMQVLALSANYNGMQMQVEPERRAAHAIQVSNLVRREYESGQFLPEQKSLLRGVDPMESGHDMTRVQVGRQHDDGKDYSLLGIRAAYHDLHDPQAGYQRGVQLDVLDLGLRVADDGSDDIGLEKIRWFGLQSYSPRDDFFHDASWGFEFLRSRELIGSDSQLLHVVNGYRGLAQDCGPFVCHAELLGGLLAGGPLDLGWTVRAGARAGLLYQRDNWSWSTDLGQQYYLVGDAADLFSLNTEAGYRLARDVSLYGNYRREDNGSANRESVSVSLRLFF